MTFKEFKEMLKKQNHPIMKEVKFMLLVTIIYVCGLGALLYLQLNKIIPSVVSLIFIVVLISIATPAIIIDLKRDKKIKKMFIYYLRENKILEEKDNIKTLKTVFISLIVAILVIGSYITPKYIIGEKEVEQIKEKEEAFDVKKKDGETIKTEYYTFNDDEFYLKIPTTFDSMSSELVRVKYPNGDIPTYTLTNEETTINVVVNVTQDKILNENISDFVMQMKELLNQTGSVLETNVYKKRNHNIGEIKFISNGVDTDIYNDMIVFSVNDTLRIVSFNCTKELQDNWKEVGEFIIKSLTFEI